MKKYGFIFCILIACKSENKGQLVVEAFGQQLYSSEIEELMNENTTYEDSVFIAKEYKNTWISRQVMLNQSRSVLSASELDKSAEMEQYKNDLLVYETLNKMALLKIDTLVSNLEIEEYYEANLKEFQLSQNIIKVDYYRIPEESAFLDPFWKKFKNNERGIASLIAKRAKEKGWRIYQNDGEWVLFDDVLKEIPINTYNQEHYLNNHKYIRIKDGEYVYFVKIIDFKITRETSPLTMAKENIRTTIIQQRQQEMVKKLETELIADAYNKNKIIIH